MKVFILRLLLLIKYLGSAPAYIGSAPVYLGSAPVSSSLSSDVFLLDLDDSPLEPLLMLLPLPPFFPFPGDGAIGRAGTSTHTGE